MEIPEAIDSLGGSFILSGECDVMKSSGSVGNCSTILIRHESNGVVYSDSQSRSFISPVSADEYLSIPPNSTMHEFQFMIDP